MATGPAAQAADAGGGRSARARVPLADRRWLLPGALGVFVVGVIAGCVMGGQALVSPSPAGPTPTVAPQNPGDSGVAGTASAPASPTISPSVEPTPSAPPSQQVPATGVLRSAGTGQCVDAENKDGAAARLTGCGDAGSQRWRLTPASEGSYFVVNEAAGKCLDVAKRSREDRAPIQVWGCNQGPNQRWTITWQGPETFALVSVNSGKCAARSGGKIEQRACGEAESQRWAF